MQIIDSSRKASKCLTDGESICASLSQTVLPSWGNPLRQETQPSSNNNIKKYNNRAQKLNNNNKVWGRGERNNNSCRRFADSKCRGRAGPRLVLGNEKTASCLGI